MRSPILSVEKVTMHFGGLTAIFDLSFEVLKGEVLGLMGPNGAGKSTLLNVISGLYKPATGRIGFKGKEITGFQPHQICHLGIARTFQIPRPFTHLTALQNVAVAAEYGRGLGKAAAEREALKVLERVGLLERRDTFTQDLAAITLKRLELARALASNPTLLLLDEVAAGLTDAEIPRILGLLKEIHGMGITIILIEHIMRIMVEAVDRIIVLDKGMKLTEGRPEEVMKDRQVIEAYLG